MKKVLVWDIDWCVEEEDVEPYELDDDVQKAINRIKSSLPYQTVLYIPNRANMEDAIANKLSDVTGWLVNNFMFKEVW